MSKEPRISVPLSMHNLTTSGCKSRGFDNGVSLLLNSTTQQNLPYLVGYAKRFTVGKGRKKNIQQFAHISTRGQFKHKVTFT